MKIWVHGLLGLAFCLSMLSARAALQDAREVTLAGFAFAGQQAEAALRFPYTRRVFQAAERQKRSFSKLILERAVGLQNPEISFKIGDLASLKTSQTLMAVLVLSGETVSTTCFSGGCRIFINLRGDAMIFDAKTHRIVRNYPLNLNVFDVDQSGKPSEEKLLALIEKALVRNDENGIISQFLTRLNEAKLPKDGVKTLNFQVASATILPEALPFLPEAMKNNPALAENSLAEIFSSIFAARLGIPMLPSRLGHAQGMMMLRLESGGDFELTIPKGDFLFELALTRFVKVKQAENTYGTNYIFGAYAKIHLHSDINDYLKTDIKNGENAEVLSTQTSFDDSPAYQDALRGIFVKLAQAIRDPAGEQADWIVTAVSAKDIREQIKKTNDLVQQLN